MPDYISRKLFERKALDRWENEGGGICADEAGTFKSDRAGGRSGNAASKSFDERREPGFAERLR